MVLKRGSDNENVSRGQEETGLQVSKYIKSKIVNIVLSICLNS